MHIGSGERDIVNYYVPSEEGEQIDLQEVTEERDLGVVVRSDLKWQINVQEWLGGQLEQ